MHKCERCPYQGYGVYVVKQYRNALKGKIICFNCIGAQLRKWYVDYGVVNAVVKTFNAPGVKK